MTTSPTRTTYLTIAEAAKYLKAGERTLRQMVSDGKLPAYRLTAGRTGPLRFKLEDLDAVLIPVPVAPKQH